jgi:hypothetical protein
MIRARYDGKINRIPETNFVVVMPPPKSEAEMRKDAEVMLKKME